MGQSNAPAYLSAYFSNIKKKTKRKTGLWQVGDSFLIFPTTFPIVLCIRYQCAVYCSVLRAFACNFCWCIILHDKAVIVDVIKQNANKQFKTCQINIQTNYAVSNCKTTILYSCIYAMQWNATQYLATLCIVMQTCTDPEESNMCQNTDS